MWLLTYLIVVLNVTFERNVYSVDEDEGTVEVCILTNIGHADPVEVVIEPMMKPGAENPAESNKNYYLCAPSYSYHGL